MPPNVSQSVLVMGASPPLAFDKADAIPRCMEPFYSMLTCESPVADQTLSILPFGSLKSTSKQMTPFGLLPRDDAGRIVELHAHIQVQLQLHQPEWREKPPSLSATMRG